VFYRDWILRGWGSIYCQIGIIARTRRVQIRRCQRRYDLPTGDHDGNDESDDDDFPHIHEDSAWLNDHLPIIPVWM
jgi:hypothetical protein